MNIAELCQWLEATAPATLVRESDYGFQLLVGTHLLGIILSIGPLLWLDLRLLGLAMPRTRVSGITRSLMPWFLVGFGVMFLSGLWLFAGYATAAYGNTFFRLKLAAIVIAGLNAVTLHFVSARTQSTWDSAGRPPWSVRSAGGVSLAMWTLVILSGRMMSYTMF